MKNISRWAAIALAVVVVIMGAMIGKMAEQVLGSLEDCTTDAFHAMRELHEQLEQVILSGEMEPRRSEAIQRSLVRLDDAIGMADHFFADWKQIRGGCYDLTRALGTTAVEINGKSARGVLYDGKVSEKELEFLRALLADIDLVLTPMLAEDGMNMRQGLLWDDIRLSLDEFCEKWETWNWAGDAPYALLNVE